ncbi:MAG: metallopeptidase TldD-related protein [Candidatus Zixiibacteriota bacterium]
MKQFTVKSHLILFSVLFLLISCLFCDRFCLAQPLEDDIVFKAMQDELARTMNQLQMEDLQRPYYVSYTVSEFRAMQIKAGFGALTQSERLNRRYLNVDLRVGDYAFDNTNFLADYWSVSPSYAAITLEDDYDAIRHKIWLSTDEAYKRALETLSKKRAYVQNKTITDLPEDFSKETPYTYSEPRASLDVDSAYWVETVKDLSSIFTEYPSLNNWKIQFEKRASNQYFVNSEGSKNRQGESLITLEVLISTQAEDGQQIFDFKTYYFKDEKDLPQRDKLKAEIKELAQRTLDITQSEKLTEYVGPVIFTQQAAAELFRQLFAANITEPRTPLFGDERFSFLIKKPKLADKVNRRIMPEMLSVKDDPTISQWQKAPLIGGYKVDDDGVMAQPVSLVEKGKLVDLLMSRTPTEKIKNSNGHARGTVQSTPKGRFSNLIVTSEQTISYDELKNQLIQYCKDSDLEYGIIVKRLKDKNLEIERSFDLSYFMSGQRKEKELTTPLEVYKVWVEDGREEPIRGAEFEAVTVKTLKDITETADDYYVHNFLLGQDNELPSTIVVPSILIEEMELTETEAKAFKPPYLKSPLSEP